MNPYSRMKMKKNIAVCSIVAVIVILAFMGVLLLENVLNRKNQYFMPSHDEWAKEGIPEEGVTRELLPRNGMRVGITVPAKYYDNQLAVNLVNYADNTVHLSVLLYDEQGKLLAESGRIYNGEYLPLLICKEKLSQEQNYILKVIAFHKEDMTSEGSIKIRMGIEEE